MDWVRVIEVGCAVLFTLAGIYAKDIFQKASNKFRLTALEVEVKQHREEFKDLNKTLQTTNQNLASLNATVQSLNGWIQRVDERQHKTGL
jgi:hypothetical protein